jgi:hypothetical protein
MRTQSYWLIRLQTWTLSTPGHVQRDGLKASLDEARYNYDVLNGWVNVRTMLVCRQHAIAALEKYVCPSPEACAPLTPHAHAIKLSAWFRSMHSHGCESKLI